MLTNITINSPLWQYSRRTWVNVSNYMHFGFVFTRAFLDINTTQMHVPICGIGGGSAVQALLRK